VPEEVSFRTKPQIALELIDRAMANGVQVRAWTFDAFYTRDGKFLDALQERGQVFVAEVPANFHGWLRQPRVVTERPESTTRGRPQTYPRLANDRPSSEVRNLVKHSPAFRKQSWQRYRIKDTDKGPEVWEVKWAVFWRKGQDGLPTRRHCLIVARNVLTGEEKYFLSNRVPGEGGVMLRWLLRVAFGRWPIESCFRQGKEELGLDHYEVRGWRCVHRHFSITQLSQLFCARVRQEYDAASKDADRISVEQVRSAMNVWLETTDAPPAVRQQRFADELKKQEYYQRRNRQARQSHTKTRLARLAALGIEVERIKSCISQRASP
jgi:SRSO17 transposase